MLKVISGGLMRKHKLKLLKKCAISILVLAQLVQGTWRNELKKRIRGAPPPWMMAQIREDLEFFKKNGFQKEMLQSNPLGPYIKSLKIRKNKIYANKNLNDLPAIKIRLTQFIEHLNNLSRCAQLPDIDLVIDLGDGYTDQIIPAGGMPVFAFSKSKHLHKTILLLPDPDNLGLSNNLAMEMPKFNQQFPWNHKISKAFWRGSTTGGMYKNFTGLFQAPRYKLVTLTKQHPAFLDGLFSNTPQCCDEVKKYLFETGLMGKHVPIREHLKYKYQILIDGNTTSWGRAQWQLLSNCVMFKQESDNIQWFYRALIPYKHYIPFDNDCSNLIEQIRWARNHERECQAIARNATHFAQQNIGYADQLYYIYLLLSEYAKLQKLSKN